ncbi:hypothetical protein T03_9986 [Trichinella britovi]|uniref:Uncharacterized protein n=1 Tax=Trichinella britovi TaxID=45882 RepID=A0A0V1CHV0_TRIBR|nr:hypothetical protein T03_9986 [Trichinella britovi]
MCGYLHLLTQSDNDAMSPRVNRHYKCYDIKKTHNSLQTIGLMHEVSTSLYGETYSMLLTNYAILYLTELLVQMLLESETFLEGIG